MREDAEYRHLLGNQGKAGSFMNSGNFLASRVFSAISESHNVT